MATIPTGQQPRQVAKVRYKPEFDRVAFKLALLGLSKDKIAANLRTTPAVLDYWCRSYPSFKNALHNGGDLADAELAHALYQTGLGYKRKITRTSVDENGLETYSETTIEEKPDVAAAKVMLGRRQGWNDKTVVEHGPIIVQSMDYRDTSKSPVKRVAVLPNVPDD